MKAVSCTKPGIDPAPAAARSAPAPRAMRLRSNQAIGLLMASSLTLVGLTRVSIGPAISVMLRGCAGLPSCAITRRRGEHRHAGLADREHMRAGADHLEEVDEVLDIFVEAEAAVRQCATSRALCQSVM